MLDLLQILGALAVLIPFVWVQLGTLRPTARGYLIFNLLGSGLLAVLALVDHSWGFLLLEAVWAVVAASSLLRKAPQLA
jgi:hypothetical protein